MLVVFISLPVNRLLLVPVSVSLSVSVYCLLFACLCLLFLSSPVFSHFRSPATQQKTCICVFLCLCPCVWSSLLFFQLTLQVLLVTGGEDGFFTYLDSTEIIRCLKSYFSLMALACMIVVAAIQREHCGDKLDLCLCQGQLFVNLQNTSLSK